MPLRIASLLLLVAAIATPAGAYRYFDQAWDTVLGNLRKRHAPGGKPID